MLSRKAEDYLERIYTSSKEKGYTRPREVVKSMGVSYPSATEMLKKLAATGLLEYERYGEVRLTPEGSAIAKKVVDRHETFEKFLRIILVSDKIAQKDACVLEHHLDQETIKQVSRFVGFVHEFNGTHAFFKKFDIYCKTGEIS